MGEGDHQKGRSGVGDFGKLLKAWRERLDPTRIPGVDASRRRLKPGLTQAEVANLTGVSLSWYRTLETGGQRQFSDGFLQRLAMTLRLDGDERSLLFHSAVGYAPAPVALATDASADGHMQDLLDQMLPHPAYLSNLRWDIIAHNAPQEDWFPWVPYEPNLMRWSFLYPEAREQLVNWRQDWARPFLAQIRYALALHPESEGLLTLRDEILRGNAEARELWDEHDSQAHPDGNVRRFRLPHHGGQEIAVRIMALAPMSNSDLRFVVLKRI
ncbi:helix-turn-helix transcriptional regulator [Streptomyces sp. NPDC052114]|uniref:helix-turn-helix transcriptional regulator n=1 Tax=unclassified Streptomyces TaxID=2593676 RepID=UPI00342A3137